MLPNDNYTLGRGKMYLGTRDRCTGMPTGQEWFFGNVPEVSLTTDSEKLEHFKSTGGLKVKDRSVMLSISRAMSFTTDNISPEAVAMAFLGKYRKFTQSQRTDAKEVFKKVTLGRFYQLGMTADDAAGVTDVKNVKLYYADASVAISLGDGDISLIPGIKPLPNANFEMNAGAGRFYIEGDAPDLLGEVQIVVQYDINAGNRETVVSGNKAIDATLRFVTDNPEGDNWVHFWPSVQLTPNGDIALISDDWMSIGFSAELLERDENTPVVISQRIPKANDCGQASVLRNIDVKATPNSIAADGAAESTITVTVTDADSAAVSGLTVLMSTNRGELSLPTGVTDSSGKVTVTLTGSEAGAATIVATVGGQTASTEVTFTP